MAAVLRPLALLLAVSMLVSPALGQDGASTPPKRVMAVVFDFDGTLTPGSHLPDVFLKPYGIGNAAYWARVGAREKKLPAAKKGFAWMEEILSNPAVKAMSNADLRAMGASFPLHPGMPKAVDEMRAIAAKEGVQIEFFIVTSGFREFVKGSGVGQKMTEVFGSTFKEKNGKLSAPKQSIGMEQKPDVLRLIADGAYPGSKGAKIALADMIYVGDGPTDAAAYAAVRAAGGKAVAAYNPAKPGGQTLAEKLEKQGKVDAQFPADYRKGSPLRIRLDEMIRATARAPRGAQPNRRVPLVRQATREAGAAGTFVVAWLGKEGLKAVETLDADRMAAAAEQMATTEFWYSFGAFVAGAKAAHKALEVGPAKRLPMKAQPYLKASLPLAAGMAASEFATTGHVDPARVGVGATAYAGLGAAFHAPAQMATRMLGPRARIPLEVAGLTATLWTGEKVEGAVWTRHEEAQR